MTTTQVKRYNIQLEGISPLIWNVRKREVDQETKALKRSELNEWEESNWWKKAEFDDNSGVIIPERWFDGMLVEAAKQTRLVPHFATTKKETYTRYVGSVMTYVLSNPICQKEDLEPYGAFVKIQNSSIWKIRPLIKKWSVNLQITDPAGRMKMEELKEILEYGGMFVGIGDNRKHRFGRFEVKSIEEVNSAGTEN